MASGPGQSSTPVSAPSISNSLDRYLIIHVATTCDEHGVYVTKDSAEVIEIGWLLLDAKTSEEVGQLLLEYSCLMFLWTVASRKCSRQTSKYSHNASLQWVATFLISQYLLHKSAVRVEKAFQIRDTISSLGVILCEKPWPCRKRKESNPSRHFLFGNSPPAQHFTNEHRLSFSSRVFFPSLSSSVLSITILCEWLASNLTI